MTPTPNPMTFYGKIVNLQIIIGGSPTINNFAHPPERPRSARPTPHSSRSGSPSASNSPRASSAVQGRSTIPTSYSHHAPAVAPVSLPSPHPEPSPSSASLLSPMGSPMEYLNDLQTHALITHSTRQSNTTEFHHNSQGRINHLPSPAVYARSNAGDFRLLSYERVDNNPSHQDGCTANLYGSTQRVSFPIPYVPPHSFPGPSVNPGLWAMPEPDRCDWFIDEREDGDYSDDEGYR